MAWQRSTPNDFAGKPRKVVSRQRTAINPLDKEAWLRSPRSGSRFELPPMRCHPSIPDFIVVLGYLDEVISCPCDSGSSRRTLWLNIGLLPLLRIAKAASKAGAALVIATWALLAAVAAWMVYRFLP
jgi:hypothetical protein